MFNAMTPLHHRKPGAAGAILFDKRIRAEIIADGIHVHPAAISILTRLKKENNLLLITDAMSATGLSDGEYTIGDLPVLVQDGIATLKDNPAALAGSTLTMIRGFRYLIQEVGLTLKRPPALQALRQRRPLEWNEALAPWRLENAAISYALMLNLIFAAYGSADVQSPLNKISSKQKSNNSLQMVRLLLFYLDHKNH